MDQLPFTQIIVDSRHAAAGTSSSFEISLPETLSLPHDAVCYVCDLQVTNTFSTVDPSKNTFYWIENESNQNVINRIFLDHKSYTPESLATELEGKLNNSSILQPNPGYHVVFDEERGSLRFTRTGDATKSFFLVNDDLLQQLASTDFVFQTYDNGTQSWTMNFANPKSAMSLLGFGPRSSENQLMPALLALGNSLGNYHYSGALDLRANHCIYLHSPTLTNYKVLGPASSRSCIARVAVNSAYGSILVHQHSGHPLDYIPCGGNTLKTLQFSLRNANNQPVDMRGGHVSFSIIFNAAPLV